MDDESFDGPGEIGQVTLSVEDLDRAVAFYPGLRLMLVVPENGVTDHGNSILYSRVSDIQTMARRMIDRGIVFKSDLHFVAKMEDHDLWMAFFHDSEGNTLALMAEIR
ncbi:MAG: VOC family protein [Fidelibacterota bacterium]